MKPVYMTLVLLILLLHAKAQLKNLDGVGSISEILLTTNKTTSLIFPFKIRYVDRGTRDVLVSKVKGAENILLLKGGKIGFEETNLSVVTADGAVHSFKINYEPSPKLWVYHYVYNTPPAMHTPVHFTGEEISESQMALYGTEIANKEPFLPGVKERKGSITFKLNGLYVKDDVLFFSLHLLNNSLLDYDIESISFFIRDKRKAKRMAIQEQEVKPLYIHGKATSIEGCTHNSIVMALPKLTLPNGKYLALEVREKNGGRHLRLKLKKSHLFKAAKFSVADH